MSLMTMGGQFEYEFFGPVGTFVCTFALPFVLYGLVYAANANGCMSLLPFNVPGWDAANTTLFSWQGLGVVYGWVLMHLILHSIMPAKRKEGVVEPDGSRWNYRLNEHLPLSWAADHYLELLTGAVVLSISLSATLYLSSFRPGAILASTGTSGCPPYDFWMGRELNPRLFVVDLKEFCELYPGLIGWVVLNLAMAHKQFVSTGQVTPAMVLVNLFQLVYVLDAMWFEPSILTTMDITTEGFGYMLAFGDLAWVPFVYSTQARFLLDNPQTLSLPAIIALVVLNFTGYAIFRGSNGQKDTFRRNPDHPSVAHLKTIPTERGTKLICSGWWGVARHINYTGDWIMGLAWCLTCGTSCAIPYFYAIYFAILLIHRESRDDHACRAKYGKDWDKYCKAVPYRLIPHVY